MRESSSALRSHDFRDLLAMYTFALFATKAWGKNVIKFRRSMQHILMVHTEAIIAPIPRPPPVISATLPDTENSLSILSADAAILKGQLPLVATVN
jgi:hypothetical protein